MNFVFELQRYNLIAKLQNILGKITNTDTFITYFCYLCKSYGTIKRQIRKV